MNIIGAAHDTLALASRHGLDNMSSDKPDADYSHLVDMLVQMEQGAMSDTKMCRWLGWMQACVYCMGENITLEDLKEINRRNAG